MLREGSTIIGAQAMEIRFGEVGGVGQVALIGRLDTTGVDQIEVRLSASVIQQGRNTVVDMSGVDYISSLGIRLLITTARSLSWKGAKLVAYGVRPAVLEIIETTAMNEIVPVVPTEADALALFRA